MELVKLRDRAVTRPISQPERPLYRVSASTARGLVNSPSDKPLLSEKKDMFKRPVSPDTAKEAHEKSQILPLKDILKTVWPTLGWRRRFILLLGFFCALLHAAGTPIFSYLFARLLSTFFVEENRSRLALKWSLSVLGVAIGDATASYFMHYLLESSGQAWIDKLRVEAFRRILEQPKAWFDLDENSVSRLNGCLDRNAEEMRNLVGRFAGFVFVAVSMTAIATIWSFIICWKLTIVALASAPAMYIIIRFFEYVSGQWESKCNDAAETAESIFTETFGSIRTVRALTLESYFREKLGGATSQVLKVGLRRSAYSGMFYAVSESAILFITGMLSHLVWVAELHH
jgi:ATP-binding cassette subfamily B (MDR/TAP) protein 1